MLYQDYFKQVNNVLENVQTTQQKAIETAAKVIADSWKQDGCMFLGAGILISLVRICSIGQAARPVSALCWILT